MRAYACNCLQTTTKKRFRVHANDKLARSLAVPVRKNTVIVRKKNCNIFKCGYLMIITFFNRKQIQLTSAISMLAAA